MSNTALAKAMNFGTPRVFADAAQVDGMNIQVKNTWSFIPQALGIDPSGTIKRRKRW
jgi:hypothetical protein